MKHDNQHYVGGTWSSSQEAQISIFDLIVTRGMGVFETFRTYNQRFFKLPEHITRLRNSARELDIQVPAALDQIEAILTEGLQKNGDGEFTIKVTITGGVNEGLLGSSDPKLLVAFLPLSVPAPEQYERGAKLLTHEELRTLPHTKSTNYIVAKRGLMRAHAAGCDDALYVDDRKRIYETTIANIFFVESGVVVTPEKGILPGITRQTILDICREKGIKTAIRDVTLDDLEHVSECFLTGSVKEVMTVCKINDREIKPHGPITIELTKAYKDKIVQATAA